MSDAFYSFPGYLIDIVDKDWITDIIEFENIDIKTEYLPNTPDSDISKRNSDSHIKKVEINYDLLRSQLF